MSLQLNKDALIPILEAAGFSQSNTHIWMILKDNTPYAVDFKSNEIFRFDGTERITKDDSDTYLGELINICVNGTVSASKQQKEETTAPCEICKERCTFNSKYEMFLCPACSKKVEKHKGVPAAVKVVGWDAYEKQKALEEGTTEEKNEFADSVRDTEDLPKNTKVPENDKPVDEQTRTFQVQPIRGILILTPQLCECGKIKIGIKGKMTTSDRGKQFRPPQKLDHFVVTTMQKKNDDFVEDKVIMDMLGSNCTEIPVILLYDDPALNFVISLAHYDSAQCQCRGNGIQAVKADGTLIECDPNTCEFAQNRLCKPNGVLSVVLQNAPRVGGVWKFRTTGWNSIRNLMSSIQFIHDLTGGRLAGLPLWLTLQPKTTVIPGTKATTTIYMVNIEYRGTIPELMSKADTRYVTAEKMALMEAKAAEMLSLPESPEECKDIQEEFYPETVVAV